MAPEFCVEITSKTIYGPVTYLMIDEDSPFSLKVKEVKEPK